MKYNIFSLLTLLIEKSTPVLLCYFLISDSQIYIVFPFGHIHYAIVANFLTLQRAGYKAN
jgi:hypothetical protein